MKIFFPNTHEIGTSTKRRRCAGQHQYANASLLGLVLNPSQFNQRLQVNGISLCWAIKRDEGG
jgi:hypothetical protein